MHRKFSQSFAIAAASLTLAGGLALPSPAQSAPDATATQNFLNGLSSILQGQNSFAHQIAVRTLGDQYNLQAAGLVCSALSQGTGVEAVLNRTVGTVGGAAALRALPPTQLAALTPAIGSYVSALIVSSAFHYCPQHRPAVEAFQGFASILPVVGGGTPSAVPSIPGVSLPF